MLRVQGSQQGVGRRKAGRKEAERAGGGRDGRQAGKERGRPGLEGSPGWETEHEKGRKEPTLKLHFPWWERAVEILTERLLRCF